jgi:glycosyltransferase involved in cell wall biosynthesis
MALKLGEYLGGKFSNANIAISEVIRQIVLKRCKAESTLIYNGVEIHKKNDYISYLENIGVKDGSYILAVARFVPEKGLHDLIDAFKEIDTNYDLVIAGDADHEDDYSRSLKQQAHNAGVKLTGYITGDSLSQIYSHAKLFVLPSYHEGLPIALLEALSYGLNVLVSDIPANLEVNLEQNHYFKCGDVNDLQVRLSSQLTNLPGDAYYRNISELLITKYNWSKIAEETVDLYKTVIKSS